MKPRGGAHPIFAYANASGGAAAPSPGIPSISIPSSSGIADAQRIAALRQAQPPPQIGKSSPHATPVVPVAASSTPFAAAARPSGLDDNSEESYDLSGPRQIAPEGISGVLDLGGVTEAVALSYFDDDDDEYFGSVGAAATVAAGSGSQDGTPVGTPVVLSPSGGGGGDDGGRPDGDDAATLAACEHDGLLRGESTVFSNIDAVYRTPAGDMVRGQMSGTSYMLRFEARGELSRELRHLPREYFHVPMGTIRRLEKVNARGKRATLFMLEVFAKDVRTLAFEFPDEHTRDRVHQVGS